MTAYKTMMRAATPLLERYLRRRAARGKEDPARAGERRGAAQLPRKPGALAWFHAASVGESLALLSIISSVLADRPGLQVLVTTGTVTSAKLMAERLPIGAFHQYIPVDQPDWVARFLDHWRPNLVVWSESEFWPNMLAGIKARGIPAVLLNARMSARSFRRWKWARGAISEVLSAFSLCLAQNDAEAQRLRVLGARDVRVSANVKYAAQPLPVDPGALAQAQAEAGARKTLLWASTHPGEEEIALETHAALQAGFPDLLTIIVPRHAARGPEVLALAQARGLTVGLRSRGEAMRQVYIADTMGELGLFYRLCRNAVIGGSFADIGGHNPIEAGQLGCVIFYGPVMYNFITINDDFLAAGAAVQVADKQALAEKLRDALQSPAQYESYAAAAQALTADKARAARELASLLDPWLDKIAAKGAAAA
ncbi:MAG TPA: 3-deoxy-D-manno-octulosonic acid transferase [Patescibacteria group bacterium]|nr:3-deoxy-D-manno-octulosonic acid transferase [Patescibacteria group bacterium]